MENNSLAKYKIHFVIFAILAVLVLLITSPQLLVYTYFTLFMVLSLFLPGYVALSMFSDLSRDERIVSSFAITIPVYAIIAVASSAFGLSSFFVYVFLIAAIFSSIYYFIKKKMHLDIIQGDKEGFCAFLILFVLTLLFVSFPFAGGYKFSPDPYPIPDRYDSFNVKIINLLHTPANDNYVPYRQAQFLINHLDIRTTGFIKEWYVNFFNRTPLMGLITTFFFQSMNINVPEELLWSVSPENQGNSYQLFQIIGAFLNSLLLLAGYLFLKKLFNKKVASISMIFLLINPFIFLNTFYTWPKSFVGYFILLSFYFLLQRRSGNQIFFSGFLAGLAYLAHDSAFIYIIGGLVYLILTKKTIDAVKFLSIAFLVALPWFAIGHFVYGESSLFIYYPFSISGMPPPINPGSVIKVFLSTPIQNIIWIRVVTGYLLLSPYYLGQYFQNLSLDNTLAPLTLFTIPGAIGIFLFPLAYYSLGKNLNIYKNEIFSFILAPLLTIIIYIGWPRGLGAFHFAETLIVIFVGFAVSLIITNRRILLSLFLLSLLNYFVILSWSYNGNPLTQIFSVRDYIILFLVSISYAAIIIYGVKKIWTEIC